MHEQVSKERCLFQQLTSNAMTVLARRTFAESRRHMEHVSPTNAIAPVIVTGYVVSS
jgi:hypothetical protein